MKDYLHIYETNPSWLTAPRQAERPDLRSGRPTGTPRAVARSDRPGGREELRGASAGRTSQRDGTLETAGVSVALVGQDRVDHRLGGLPPRRTPDRRHPARGLAPADGPAHGRHRLTRAPARTAVRRPRRR